MIHDELCELERSRARLDGPSCHCASRAYEADPFPLDLPIRERALSEPVIDYFDNWID